MTITSSLAWSLSHSWHCSAGILALSLSHPHLRTDEVTAASAPGRPPLHCCERMDTCHPTSRATVLAVAPSVARPPPLHWEADRRNVISIRPGHAPRWVVARWAARLVRTRLTLRRISAALGACLPDSPRDASPPTHSRHAEPVPLSRCCRRGAFRDCPATRRPRCWVLSTVWRRWD
jgi:hypothetical protein